ncbi:MAG: glycosyltransferase family 4 protein [Candidatus Hydrogenedentes bacterium]|nr:glycosyltransferase family 4 protein [Candidatus Hydrogenedentota bacterium]
MACSPLNVLFLTLYPDSAASPRYRVLQFVPYLRSIGFRCTVESAVSDRAYKNFYGPLRSGRPFWYHADETPRRVLQILRARKYDVVFVQKAIMSAYVRGMHTLLRANAKRLVYDIDDAVHLRPPHSLFGVWKSLEDEQQVLRLSSTADLVLAGNAWLASEMREHAKRVEFFPTVVDTDYFFPAPSPPSSMVVGWIGSPSTTPHLSAAECLGGLDHVSLRAVGADAGCLPWSDAESIPWRRDTEVAALRSFSVGVMPLVKDDWTRGKCALKALQYMACGVPCVATPYGAVLDIIADNVNGLFADTPEEWLAAIEWLRDESAHKKLADAGRATVEQHFSLKPAAPKLAELLESVV